jgi:hypothetical protein
MAPVLSLSGFIGQEFWRIFHYIDTNRSRQIGSLARKMLRLLHMHKSERSWFQSPLLQAACYGPIGMSMPTPNAGESWSSTTMRQAPKALPRR